ncbi:MAG: hypothetical protein F6K50_06675 [Moorea sp. SIO3I7]|uniref:hypothetical protein n=1 Tax=Moorena sp. SIO3I8 TaxID=2607833 RepID=UPI0013BF1E4F|nr:hypothetical protein [Moorena sp. SIO3I8]NEN95224.1 hypothetical protein [Moorena sp. SIO3I7]NEO05882.1 hypothetical protein [Moorena sp. SIO3I8]
MKFAYKNIKSFTLLIQNNPEILSIQDRQNLEENLPEDIENILKFILDWCQKRPEVNQALRQVRKTLPDDKNKSKIFGFDDPKAEEEQEQYEAHLRITLINTLRQSYDPEKSKSKTTEEKLKFKTTEADE